MASNAEGATRKLVKFCRTRGSGCFLRALARWTNFVMLSLILSPPLAKSAENSDVSVSELFEKIKTKPVELRHFLQNFPKGGDLHSHLSGAVYAESYLAIALKRNLCVNLKSKALAKPPCDPIKSPPVRSILDNKDEFGFENFHRLIDALSTRYYRLRSVSGRDQFFSTFQRFFQALDGSRGDMLAEVASRAGRQKILYLELMQSLGMFEVAQKAQSHGDLDAPFGSRVDHLMIEAEVAKVVKRLDQIEARRDVLLGCGSNSAQQSEGCSVEVRYLAQVIRELSPIEVYAQALLAFKLIESDVRVVGLNFVAPEDSPVALRDYKRHMKWIAELNENFPEAEAGVTLHAGELTLGLVPPRHLGWHIREAVMVAGADRIGHGIDISYDEQMYETLAYMAENKIAVEINLTSNEVILGVKGEDHPFTTYMANGVPLTISTDDEGVSRIDLTNEYHRLVRTYDVDYATLVSLSRNSLQYSFLPGAALFEDTYTGRKTEECRHIADPKSVKPEDSCAELLSSSPKASLQWKLEENFISFEACINNQFDELKL